MSVLIELEKAKAAKLIFDGHPDEAIFHPGISEEAIKSLEWTLKATLPTDYRELLKVCAGIDSAYLEIDFSMDPEALGLEDMLPHKIPFASDGCGNFYVVDCLKEQEEESTVYWACHDAPVLLFQCKGIANFLSEFVKAGQPGATSLLTEVMADSPYSVWTTNPGLISYEELQASTDPVLRDFATTLDPTYVAIDLRNPQPGMGFSWGRSHHDSPIKRAGQARVFAYSVPPKKKGLLSWFK